MGAVYVWEAALPLSGDCGPPSAPAAPDPELNPERRESVWGVLFYSYKQ